MESQQVKLNGQSIANPNQLLQRHDLLSTKTMVTEKPIPVMHQVEVIKHDPLQDLLVIAKPCGVPVHACGRYRKNTLVYILRTEFMPLYTQQLMQEQALDGLIRASGRWNALKLVHRLDRVTSGVLMLTTSEERNRIYHRVFADGKMQKYYLARVHKRMKQGEAIHIKKALKEYDPRRGLWKALDYEEPTQQDIDSKQAHRIKTAHTIFECLSYDATTDTSLVFCVPLTGRTHQLREHLRYLGHDIVNDPEIDPSNTNESQDTGRLWQERMQTLIQCNGDMEKASHLLLERQLQDHDAFWMKQQFQICLHALRYECNDTLLPQFYVQTKFLPEWVFNPDSIHSILASMIHENIQGQDALLVDSIDKLVGKYTSINKE